ncbi:cyclophilin-like domain-containing protein [Geopyxis carbonaria]|nr:cyclophilin-like domain-containing protein [Geopyxis carbonaria]
MAQLYTLEPQTNAKVLLKTTYGDLELELWGRECPQTVRNFLQHCYDGYYTDTIFHRLVPGFVLQGGDPTGTGHGGEAIYPGGLFADEFHPRLKYNRRGLLGMANGGRANDNGSQFFLTLGDTRDLNTRNTLFGKVVGDTIYNLVRMGELECDERNPERPLFPPRVTGAEVLVNPFDDVAPRAVVAKTDGAKKDRDRARAKKKKGGKQLLSFADDGEEEVVLQVKKKPKFDARLVVDDPALAAAQRAEADAARPRQPTPPPARTPTPPPVAVSKQKQSPPRRRLSRTPTPPPTALETANAKIAALRASLRRSASPPPPTAASKPRSLLTLQKQMLPATSVQGRKRRRAAGAHAEDVDAAYGALAAFRAKLAAAASAGPVAAPAVEGEKIMGAPDGEAEMAECDLHFVPGCQSCRSWDVQAAEDGEGEGGGRDVKGEELWGHKLSFEKDRRGKDLSWKKRNEELVVIDPREREREIVGRGRGGRGGRGGGGGDRGMGRGGERGRGGGGGERGMGGSSRGGGGSGGERWGRGGGGR